SIGRCRSGGRRHFRAPLGRGAAAPSPGADAKDAPAQGEVPKTAEDEVKDMLRATEIVPAGQWLGPPADVVRLDYDRRTRRRIALTGNAGTAFLLDLAKAPVLAAGDGLKL